jgi:hypothetical protein
MTTAVGTSGSSKPMPSARNPELPLLAARAAAQIDALIRGENPASGADQPIAGAVEGFMALLNNLELSHPGGNAVRSFMDPTSSRMLKIASERAKLATTIESYRELGEVLLKIQRMLDDTLKPGSVRRPELEKLRSFFINLSDFAAAEGRAFASRPKQPYRR